MKDFMKTRDMDSSRGKYQKANDCESDEAEYDPTSGPSSDLESSYSTEESFDGSQLLHRQLDYIHKAENKVEAQKNLNNLVFGLKKWDGLVTRSRTEVDLMQELYEDQEQLAGVSTLGPGNIIYVVMVGWWLSLAYLIVALLMLCTIVGRAYAPFCFTLAKYFIWPFGKFILRDDPLGYDSVCLIQNGHKPKEHVPLIGAKPVPYVSEGYGKNKWDRKQTYVWCILGVPLLFVLHGLVFAICWLTVVFIPTAKVQNKVIRKVLLMPPELLRIDKSSFNPDHPVADIVAYTYQAANFHYWKLSVDGINVILANMMLLVVVTVILGFSDPGNKIVGRSAKFVMSLLSIMPLSYYIGMAITSIAAQSNPALGALLNATFGSLVELLLYTMALFKQGSTENRCFTELVKSGFIGTVLATLVMIPGVCMILGGFKFRSQKFNPHSVGVSSTLAFVAVACIFAPTIFAKLYGPSICSQCINGTLVADGNNTDVGLITGYFCQYCDTAVLPRDGGPSPYQGLVRPLAYCMATMLFGTYIVGLVFSLKTHRQVIHDKFQEESEADGSHAEAVAHWSRTKSCLLLLVCTVLLGLSAEILTSNLEPVLADSGMSVYFIGVTIMAVVPDIPEVVNGILFALHNDISLSIEVGTSMAVQVCMVQMPILMVLDVIFDLHFYLLFEDIHVWAVLFSVFMMNYVLQDGKANYFQGVAVTTVYVALILMYFFIPATLQC